MTDLPAPSTAADRPMLRGALGQPELVAYGLAYVALVSPLSTLGIVWQASGGLIAAAYLLAVVCMGFTAISYAVMSTEMPSAGSAYAFTRQTFGPWLGFLSGWMLLLDYLLTPALVFVLMSAGMEAVVPAVGRMVWLVLLAGTVIVVNWYGIVVTLRASKIAVAVQAVFVVVFLGLCAQALMAKLGSAAFSLRPFYDAARFDLSKLVGGTGLCLLSFLGFDAISTLAEEVRRDDRQLVGRATLWVLLLSGLMFVAMAWVLGNVMPVVVVKSDVTAVFDIGEQLLGPAALLPMALVMVFVAGFTTSLPMQASVARVLFAMGRDGQLPSALAQVHPRTGTPHVALLVSAAVSFGVAFVMLDHVELLTATVCFGALAAFTMLHVAVWVRMGLRARSRRIFVHWLAPILGAVVCTAVLAGLPTEAQRVGGAWLAVGAAAAWWTNRAR
jgi:amino acid transporter